MNRGALSLATFSRHATRRGQSVQRMILDWSCWSSMWFNFFMALETVEKYSKVFGIQTRGKSPPWRGVDEVDGVGNLGWYFTLIDSEYNRLLTHPCGPLSRGDVMLSLRYHELTRGENLGTLQQHEMGEESDTASGIDWNNDIRLLCRTEMKNEIRKYTSCA